MEAESVRVMWKYLALGDGTFQLGESEPAQDNELHCGDLVRWGQLLSGKTRDRKFTDQPCTQIKDKKLGHRADRNEHK